MMSTSTMSLPVCAAPSAFSVMHPLHCGSASYAATASPSFTTSPMRTPARPAPCAPTPRAQPAASPSKKPRKSRVVFDFTTEEMAKYFHMSQREAAQQLGVATVTIKRNCRRLGIVWPYRLMKSKKQHPMTWAAISRDEAQRIRQQRALERAKAGRSPSSRRSRSRSRSRSPSTVDLTADATAAQDAATAMTMLSHCAEKPLTPAGRAFARLPLDAMDGEHY